jgi:hypothetical protein
MAISAPAKTPDPPGMSKIARQPSSAAFCMADMTRPGSPGLMALTGGCEKVMLRIEEASVSSRSEGGLFITHSNYFLIRQLIFLVKKI